MYSLFQYFTVVNSIFQLWRTNLQSPAVNWASIVYSVSNDDRSPRSSGQHEKPNERGTQSSEVGAVLIGKAPVNG